MIEPNSWLRRNRNPPLAVVVSVNGVDRGEPAGGVPDHHPALQAEVVGQGGARQVAAEESAELVSRARTPAGGRWSAAHRLRSPGRTGRRGRARRSRRCRRAPGRSCWMMSSNRYCASSRVASYRMAASSPRMISTCRPEMPATRRRISTSTPRPSARWNETISVLVRASGHRGQHAGPFGHIHRRPEQVHGVAAGPHPGQRHPLDHRHREPLPGKPVRRRRARDTRPRRSGPATAVRACRHPCQRPTPRDRGGGAGSVPVGMPRTDSLLVDHSRWSPSGGTRHLLVAV